MYFFLLPMVIMLCGNIIIGIPSLINIIRQAETLPTQHESQLSKNNHSSNFTTRGILKISFLMGCVWLCGVLGRLLDSFAFNLMFVIMGSFQGAFLFLFFAMTTQVRKLMFKGSNGSSGVEAHAHTPQQDGAEEQTTRRHQCRGGTRKNITVNIDYSYAEHKF